MRAGSWAHAVINSSLLTLWTTVMLAVPSKAMQTTPQSRSCSRFRTLSRPNPCHTDRKDQSHRLKGVTPGTQHVEAEPRSEFRSWLLALHSLHSLCHTYFSFPTTWPWHFTLRNCWPALAHSVTSLVPATAVPKVPELFLTPGYRRSSITTQPKYPFANPYFQICWQWVLKEPNANCAMQTT